MGLDVVSRNCRLVQVEYASGRPPVMLLPCMHTYRQTGLRSLVHVTPGAQSQQRGSHTCRCNDAATRRTRT
jgi:hypothetical protein